MLHSQQCFPLFFALCLLAGGCFLNPSSTLRHRRQCHLVSSDAEGDEVCFYVTKKGINDKLKGILALFLQLRKVSETAPATALLLQIIRLGCVLCNERVFLLQYLHL